MVLQPSAVHKDSPSKRSTCTEPAEPPCCSRGVGLPLCGAAAPAHGYDFQAGQTTAPCHGTDLCSPLIPGTAAQAILEHHPHPLLSLGFAGMETLLCIVPSRHSFPTGYECSLPTLVCFRTYLCVCPFRAPHMLCNEGETSSTAAGETGHCQRSQLLGWVQWVRIPDKFCMAELTNRLILCQTTARTGSGSDQGAREVLRGGQRSAGQVVESDRDIISSRNLKSITRNNGMKFSGGNAGGILTAAPDSYYRAISQRTAQ